MNQYSKYQKRYKMKKRVFNTSVIAWIQVCLGIVILAGGIAGIFLMRNATDNNIYINGQQASSYAQSLLGLKGNLSNETLFLALQNSNAYYSEADYQIRQSFVAGVEIMIILIVMSILFLTQGAWKLLKSGESNEKRK